MPDLFYPIQLTHGHSSLGSLRELGQSGETRVAITSSATQASIGFQTVTGITESRLEEVRTYNLQQPYIIGINGVQTVTNTEVVYALDGVTYTTSLIDTTTTYSLGLVSAAQALQIHFLYRDERDVFIDKQETQGDILMERAEMSVFDSMIRIAGVNSLDDLTDYFNT